MPSHEVTQAGATALPRRKRRWLRFSLRSLLVATALLSVFLAWIGNILIRVRHQRAIVTQLQSLGATYYYDYQPAGPRHGANSPPGPRFVRYFLGDDAYAYVEAVSFDYKSRASEKDLGLLAELPELKYVDLYGPEFTDVGMDDVAALPKLRGLGLSDTSVTADGLARLASAASFTSLTLYGATVNDKTIQHLDILPNLETLGLQETNVTSDGLAQLSNLSRLRYADIVGNRQIGDEGLAHLAHLKNLERLQLFETSVSDDGLVYLRELTQLKTLTVRNTSVSDKSLEHIAALHELVYLDLCDTSITDDGLAHLARLSHLETLHLGFTAVTDDGILRLAALRNLKYLDVGPNVTRAGAMKLVDALPNCRVCVFPKSGSTFNVP